MKSGKSNPVFRDDYKRIRQSICMIFQQPLDYSYFVSDPFIIQPEQHHTSMRPLFAVDFLTEILVRVGGTWIYKFGWRLSSEEDWGI